MYLSLYDFLTLSIVALSIESIVVLYLALRMRSTWRIEEALVQKIPKYVIGVAEQEEADIVTLYKSETLCIYYAFQRQCMVVFARGAEDTTGTWKKIHEIKNVVALRTFPEEETEKKDT